MRRWFWPIDLSKMWKGIYTEGDYSHGNYRPPVYRYEFLLEKKHSFGFTGRPGIINSGIDFPTEQGKIVSAMEDGVVIYVGQEWHGYNLPLRFLLVEGASGVICYCGLQFLEPLIKGDILTARKAFATMAQDLLHIELYKPGTKAPTKLWDANALYHLLPEELLDPTENIKNSRPNEDRYDVKTIPTKKLLSMNQSYPCETPDWDSNYFLQDMYEITPKEMGDELDLRPHIPRREEAKKDAMKRKAEGKPRKRVRT